MTRHDDHFHKNRFETLAVGTAGNATRPDEGGTSDVIPPLHFSSTFERASADEANEHAYSRASNTNAGGPRGAVSPHRRRRAWTGVRLGMAAISTTMLSLIPPGNHVVSTDSVYSGTEKLLTELVAGHLGVDVEFVNAHEPESVAAVVDLDTDLIWAETPTNPLMRLCDIYSIADIAHDHGIPFGVDSTFASPYFQVLLELGADIAVHSTTKYINGLSDSIDDAVVTNDDGVFEKLPFSQRIGLGNMLSPFACYLIARGIKTLPARMEDHQENAMAVARLLEAHNRVTRVHYLDLESHPQHDLAVEQMSGYSGMLSFEFDGTLAELEAFVDGLEMFTLGASLGGVESPVEVPSLMIPDEVCHGSATADIPETLIRISIGIEHVDDLRENLRAALP